MKRLLLAILALCAAPAMGQGVCEADGSPCVPVNKLEFNQADGLTVVDEGITTAPYHRAQINLLVPRINFGSSLPATCTASNGEVFFLTTATAGENLYVCTATDTWTVAYGVSATWEGLTNSADTATTYTSDNNAETFTLDFQSAFSTDRFRLIQSTGNPTAGTLFTVALADPNVTPFEIEMAGSPVADAIQITSSGGTAGDIFTIREDGVIEGNTLASDVVRFDLDQDNNVDIQMQKIGTQAVLSWTSGQARFASHVRPQTDSLYDLGASTLYWANTYTDTLSIDGTAASSLLIQPSSEPSGIVELFRLYDTTGTTPYFRVTDTGEVRIDIDGAESTKMVRLYDGASELYFIGQANGFQCTNLVTTCEINFRGAGFRIQSDSTDTNISTSSAASPMIFAPRQTDFITVNNDGTSASMDLEATSGQTADLLTVTTNGGSAGDLLAVQADGDVVGAQNATFEHYLGGGTTPSVADDGDNNSTIAGKDAAWKVTVGTGTTVTSITVTFGQTYGTAPVVVCNADTTTAINTTSTTTTATLSASSFTASEVVGCMSGGY